MSQHPPTPTRVSASLPSRSRHSHSFSQSTPVLRSFSEAMSDSKPSVANNNNHNSHIAASAPASASSSRRASAILMSGASTPASRSTPPPPPIQTASGISGSGSATPPLQKTRARDLLRKHYGLGLGPPPPLQGVKGSMDPMDLDSSVFDAKSYYEQLITTASLPTLLKKENELLIDVRQLDSERQSLVYNHHHELIAASDTIGAMKNRAIQLDSDMDELKNVFSAISRLTNELALEQHSQFPSNNTDDHDSGSDHYSQHHLRRPSDALSTL